MTLRRSMVATAAALVLCGSLVVAQEAATGRQRPDGAARARPEGTQRTRPEGAERTRPERPAGPADTQPAGENPLAWRVPTLPADNLVKNPWFRSGTKPAMEPWVSDGHWEATNKHGNPTPDNVEGTAARISTGRRTDSDIGKSVDVGVGTRLYQVIPAEPTKKVLKFDMYWVTHTVNPATVTVYGGPSAQGPWTELWKPFHQVQIKSLSPTSGTTRGQDLWKDFSAKTDLVHTTLESGHPFYKLEITATLPDRQGGLKLTGVYFAVADTPPVTTAPASRPAASAEPSAGP